MYYLYTHFSYKVMKGAWARIGWVYIIVFYIDVAYSHYHHWICYHREVYIFLVVKLSFIDNL